MPRIFSILLVVLGLAFAGISIYFALLPTDISNYNDMHGGSSKTTTNANSGDGAIATGIVSAGCFIAAGILMKRNV